jgi:hypothetical protein
MTHAAESTEELESGEEPATDDRTRTTAHQAPVDVPQPTLDWFGGEGAD